MADEETERGSEEGEKVRGYCRHCGTVEVFVYSEKKTGYYCRSCGAILEG